MSAHWHNNRVTHRSGGVSVLHILYKGTPLECLIDTEDYAKVQSFKWHARSDNGIEQSWHVFCTKLRKYLHQFLMGEGFDHINTDGLDNRKQNLRKATQQQNNRNRRKRSDGVTSKYKGVCFRKKTGRWLTQLNGKHVGSFATELEAAQAYNTAAKTEHGEFALLNQLEA